MKIERIAVRSGYDNKRCLAHARCCFAPGLALATAQYLDVTGCDLFGGLQSALSFDGGATWTDFEPQAGLAPRREGELVTVGCDATPLYHKKTGRILLLGHTARYADGKKSPVSGERGTFWSVFDPVSREFSPMRILKMPGGYENCGNGSGQSVELDNGDILVPVYFAKSGETRYSSAVMRCAFDGSELTLLEIGAPLDFPVARGIYEPSVIRFGDGFYITARNDECGLVAESRDGLNYTGLRLWRWEDGSVLQNYNTQQHWMILSDGLYLVYTRRGAANGHVFRHRAPLFAARVKDMKLIRDSETVIVEERGARLGNFSVAPCPGGAAVMAAEWMQPIGCEKYGSDNTVWLSRVSAD